MNFRPTPTWHRCPEWLSAVLAAFLILTSPVTARAKTETGEKMWVLEQASELWGPVTTRFCKRGARIDFMRLNLLVTPNAKRSIVFSPAQKTFSDFDVSKLGHPRRNVEEKIRTLNAQTTVTGKFLGYSVQKYLLPAKDGEEEAWMTREIVVPQEFVRTLTVLMKFPSEFGLPLRLFHKTPDGKKVTIFDTLSIKQLAYEPQLFVPPDGYRKISDPYDILLYEQSSGVEQDTGELLKSSGVHSRLLEHNALDEDAQGLMQANPLFKKSTTTKH